MNNIKTLQVLQLLSKKPRLSQRAIAAASGLSLGLVNLIIKRLIQTGHIKISNLSKKRIEYLLTPKGFIDTANHSYAYLTRAISTFKESKMRLTNLIEDLAAQGHRNFVILGKGEIADLLNLVLESFPEKFPYRRAEPGGEVQPQETVLDCRLNGKLDGLSGISVMAALLDIDPGDVMSASARSSTKPVLVPGQ